MPPPVTIITATYNRTGLVTRAIDSVLWQTYPSPDVVVVDDGSTDEMPNLLQRYDAEARRYGKVLLDVAKWAAIAGERARAGAVSREAIRSCDHQDRFA
jgi:glycosyltransferase involved in cell wall biosynthesis